MLNLIPRRWTVQGVSTLRVRPPLDDEFQIALTQEQLYTLNVDDEFEIEFDEDEVDEFDEEE